MVALLKEDENPGERTLRVLPVVTSIKVLILNKTGDHFIGGRYHL